MLNCSLRGEEFRGRLKKQERDSGLRRIHQASQRMPLTYLIRKMVLVERTVINDDDGGNAVETDVEATCGGVTLTRVGVVWGRCNRCNHTGTS
jgi:hypothetical protein